jgi:hypothetical protein
LSFFRLKKIIIEKFIQKIVAANDVKKLPEGRTGIKVRIINIIDPK